MGGSGGHRAGRIALQDGGVGAEEIGLLKGGAGAWLMEGARGNSGVTRCRCRREGKC
jgi:hypothetical protein